MNKKNLYYLAVGVAIFFCGLFIGHQSGEKPCPDMQSQYSQLIVTELNSEIKLLSLLRTGEVDRSVAILENLADTNIDFLYAKINRTEINQQASKEIIEAIKGAKKYREKHPEHKPVEGVSKSIEEAFRNVGE